jgi:hypothetical protein
VIRAVVDEQPDPVYSTHLTQRLEAFSDIVFGFSLSVDVILLLAQLAGAAIVPFALQIAEHSGKGTGGFTLYALDLATVYFIFGVLRLRGLRFFGDRLSAAAALRVYQGIIARLRRRNRAPRACPRALLPARRGRSSSSGFSSCALVWD